MISIDLIVSDPEAQQSITVFALFLHDNDKLTMILETRIDDYSRIVYSIQADMRVATSETIYLLSARICFVKLLMCDISNI